MKKILLAITIALVLTGCNQVNDILVTENANTYHNEEFNISFQYPSNWKVDSQERFKHAVGLVPGSNEYIFLDYQSENFDEYESNHNESGDGEIGGLKIEEITMANYPAKKYTEYGVELAAVKYIIEKNGKFIQISTESGLTEEQKSGVEKILNSLVFK